MCKSTTILFYLQTKRYHLHVIIFREKNNNSNYMIVINFNICMFKSHAVCKFFSRNPYGRLRICLTTEEGVFEEGTFGHGPYCKYRFHFVFWLQLIFPPFPSNLAFSIGLLANSQIYVFVANKLF